MLWQHRRGICLVFSRERRLFGNEMPKQSAGLLLYRSRPPALEVFLVHPGGPFWAKKDLAAWSIPKGEFGPGEEPLAAAQREFTEETGFTTPGPFLPLGSLRQPGGKIIHAYAAAAELDPGELVSGTFNVEWPPRSGRIATFPEVDRAEWFPLQLAAAKLHSGQVEFLARLKAAVQPPDDPKAVGYHFEPVRVCAARSQTQFACGESISAKPFDKPLVSTRRENLS
ncbi:MAG: hypothetical protein RIQ93_686 [Verrucomicrobiota bacterium]|jgi:predicted NUDIX family NTP pyrophosphohydrolase